MEKHVCSETLTVLTLNALAKVFPKQKPAEEYALKQLSALKGETVSFQIAYYWDSETRSFVTPVVTSPLKEHITIRQVVNVPCEMPSHIDLDEDYLSTEPGLYPDRLEALKEQGADLNAGCFRALWVDLEIPEDFAAGTWPVRIQLQKQKLEAEDAAGGTRTFSEETVGVIETEVEVIDAVLPKLPIPHTEWFHCDCLSNYYGVEVFSEEFWSIVENFVKTAVKRKMNMILTPIFTPPLDTAIGGERKTVQLVEVTKTGDTYSFGFEKLERWIKLCKGCGITYFEISHLFSQWGAVATPKVMATVDGTCKRLFGWETKADGAEYSSFLHCLLPQLIAKLKTLTDMEQVYFHISDEPNINQLESYRAALNVVKEDLKGCKLLDALSNYDFYREGLVEIPVCANNHIQPFLENRPKELWSYYCTAQYKGVSNRFIAQPSYRNRVYGLQLYKYQIDGILHWGYNFYNSLDSMYSIDPYRTTGADGTFPSGDPFLVYPGKDTLPEESIRMMVHDEALSDLCALYKLERLIGREKVLEAFAEEFADLEFDCYPKTPEYTLSVREKVNAMIREAL